MARTNNATVNASTSPEPEKKLTVLEWIKYPPTSVYVNDTFTMSAQLTDFTATEMLSGKPIDLYRNGQKIKSGNTDEYGMVTFTDSVATEGSYEYYMDFIGDAEWIGCDGESRGNPNNKSLIPLTAILTLLAIFRRFT